MCAKFILTPIALFFFFLHLWGKCVLLLPRMCLSPNTSLPCFIFDMGAKTGTGRPAGPKMTFLWAQMSCHCRCLMTFKKSTCSDLDPCLISISSCTFCSVSSLIVWDSSLLRSFALCRRTHFYFTKSIKRGCDYDRICSQGGLDCINDKEKMQGRHKQFVKIRFHGFLFTRCLSRFKSGLKETNRVKPWAWLVIVFVTVNDIH